MCVYVHVPQLRYCSHTVLEMQQLTCKDHMVFAERERERGREGGRKGERGREKGGEREREKGGERERGREGERVREINHNIL